MRSKFRFVVILISFFVLAGCVKLENKIEINPDGSGKIIQSRVEDKDIFGMTGMRSGILNPNQYEQSAKELGKNVKLETSEEFLEKNLQGQKLVYSFKNISDVNWSMFNIEFSMSENGFSIKVLPSSNAQNVKQMPLEMAKNNLKGLSYKLVILFNSQIDSTNASFRDVNSITLADFEFDKLISLNDNKKVDDISVLDIIGDFDISSQNISKETMYRLNELGFSIETKDEIFIKLKKNIPDANLSTKQPKMKLKYALNPQSLERINKIDRLIDEIGSTREVASSSMIHSLQNPFYVEEKASVATSVPEFYGSSELEGIIFILERDVRKILKQENGADIKISSIVDRAILVSGKWYKAGDSIGDYRLVKVHHNHAFFQNKTTNKVHKIFIGNKNEKIKIVID